MSDRDHLALAAEFPAATYAQWRKLAETALKGAPFDSLLTRTHDGLTIEPLQPRASDAQAIAGRALAAPWEIMQRVDHPDPAAANAEALHDLENGATGLTYVCVGSVSANGYGLDPSPETLARVLDGVVLDAVAIDFNLSPATRTVVRHFADLVKRRNVAPASVEMRASLNPIGGFAVAGSSSQPWAKLADDVTGFVNDLARAGFRGPFVVADGRVIHNAGGSEAQELAFAIASAVSYLRAFDTGGIPLEAARAMIYFRLSADAEQFLTIAKFRAVRQLWARIEEACGLIPKPVHVAAETAWRMMTKHDPHVNILRTTIAVFAAGVGGADSITVLPHTAPLGLPDRFARRVARNTQLVLLQEAYLAKVADPAAGSGAIEALTQQLCERAWSLFQEIERAGGIWVAIEAGLMQRNVAAVRTQRIQAAAHASDVLIGTNAFPHLQEAAAGVLDIAPHPATSAHEMAGAASLPRIRLAEPFEALRDASDRVYAATKDRPRIFLATLGRSSDFTARATYAKNFFAAGGIGATGDAKYENDEAILVAFKAAGVKLACLCGSDGALAREGAVVTRGLRAAGARHIYAVGAPDELREALRAAGAETVIDSGCDMLATLQAAWKELNG